MAPVLGPGGERKAGPPAEGPNGPVAVVAERVGKGGKRFVAYSTGKVEEVDEAQYQKVRFTNS